MSRTPKILFSNMNIGMTPHALKPLEWLGDFAKGAGFDGVQYTPVFDLVPGHRPKDVAAAHNAGKIAIGSFEAAYRETRRSADTHRSPIDERPRRFSVIGSAVRSPLGRLIMPETISSVQRIREIQDNIVESDVVDIPVTLYPQRSLRRDEPQVQFVRGSKLCQPRDQLAELVDAQNTLHFDQKMHGFRGYEYALDTFHARTRAGKDKPGIISDIEHSVPLLAPHVKAMHIAVGRTDIPGESHIPTMAEAADVLKGDYNGEMGYMIDVAKELGDVEYVVMENPWAAAVKTCGHAAVHDVQQAYGDMVNGFVERWNA